MLKARIEAFAREHGLQQEAVEQLCALLDLARLDASEPALANPSAPLQEQASSAVETAATAHNSATVFFGNSMWDPEDAPATEVDLQVLGEPRYRDLCSLGVGGMGEVRRVFDHDLHRVVAMKIALPGSSARLSRFHREALITARLQHPGIVPVYECGRLEDARAYFTMREVRGRTLSHVIRELHASSGTTWQPGPSGLTFRRVIEAFRTVCEIVAYAHARGVIHRDLKPANIMIGEYGEVQVMDWGLAKVLGGGEAPDEEGLPDAPVLATTLHGSVSGTPAYMPPEQARGEVDLLDRRTDVYALGSVLYEVLAGRPPYVGTDAHEIIERVLAGAPVPVAEARAGGPVMPAELVTVCETSMARSPSDRYADAAELAEQIAEWLDGARRQERARNIVVTATERAPDAAALRDRARAARERAETLLAEVAPWEPEERKAPGWAKEDEAAKLEAQANLVAFEVEHLLQGALTHADLEEAHVALIERYLAQHGAAEAERNEAGAARARVLLQSHSEALPSGHPVRAHCGRYLQGDGALTLHTDPPGAEVWMERYVLHRRRLVLQPVGLLGRTPLVAVTVPIGSYRLRIRMPGRQDVLYPIRIPRLGHWDGVPPGASEPQPVWLPPEGLLGEDDCYVPAGWFWCGGDPEAANSLPGARVWLDGFVMRRHPVTNREYLAFLDDLAATVSVEAAEEHVPRERSGIAGELGPALYARDARGRYYLRPDSDGDCWDPDWPVLMVTHANAAAFAAWTARRTGQPWRLPWELEWEKAARGVDRRFLPWGDTFDFSYACASASHATRPLPATIAAFPVDESPYGIRGMAGNAHDRCLDAWPRASVTLDASGRPVHVPSADDTGYRVCRGGTWTQAPRMARAASRFGADPGDRNGNLGFRLARDLSDVRGPGTRRDC